MAWTAPGRSPQLYAPRLLEDSCCQPPARACRLTRFHAPPPPHAQANPLKPSVGTIIDELANLKNSTGRGKEAYDNFGKELDPLQVTSA